MVLPYHTDERGKIITEWIMTRAARDDWFRTPLSERNL